MSDFGTLLRAYREGRGLSLNGLARRVPCDPSHLSRMESGQRPPAYGPMLGHIMQALALDDAEQYHLALTAVGMPDTWGWAQTAIHEATMRAANAIIAACPCESCGARRQEATA